MNRRLEDECMAPSEPVELPAPPLAMPLFTSSVYRCANPDQAASLLSGEEPGFVYSRDGNPNSASLAARCAALHRAERAAPCATGMGALATLALATLESGEHVVVSKHLYGASLELLTREVGRFGVQSTIVDTCDLAETERSITPRTKLVVVETITNPLLRVSNLAELAKLAHASGAELAVDNSLASPIVCRPIEHGADWVIESLTKISNGHSDAVLGLIAGKASRWERVAKVLSRWGLASSPFDCWMTERGIATLALRANAAGNNAIAVAKFLADKLASGKSLAEVHYPGLPNHPDHALAKSQFEGKFGAMVTFTLSGGRAAAEQFIAAVADRIPFCPSLGEISTTLSHPQSTSHRGLSEEERLKLGISGGTIRLSVGIESIDSICEALDAGLAK